MKKYYFLALVLLSSLLSFSLCASAQISTRVVSVPSCQGDTNYTIGRVSTDGEHIISFHHDGYLNEFHWSDPINLATKKFKIPMLVNDFEVYDGFVFFCGTHQGNGVVGYFAEDAFINGFNLNAPPLVPYIYYPDYNFSFISIAQVENMTRLEVFENPEAEQITIAAVGEMFNYLTDARTNIFLITLSHSNGITAYYDYYPPLFYVGSPYRLIEDVAITDNYIVTSGVTNLLSQDNIVMTVIDKNNISSLYYYLSLETAGDMNSYYYSIESTKSDQVVISSLLYNNTEKSFVIPLHVFDASIHDFINSQIVPVYQKTEFNNDMQYFSEDYSLLLLQRNYYPQTSASQNPVIYDLMPYNTTPYTTNTIYDYNGNNYNSLDRFPSYSFLASGESNTLEHLFMLRDKSASFQSYCFKTMQHTVLPTQKPSSNQNTPLTSTTTYVTIDILYPDITILQMIEECNQ